MTKQEIVKELSTILKTYHYDSDEQHISKDVVTSLENIIISLTSWIKMSELKFCQGPDCHTYKTQDRLKGSKDNKTYQSRRRSRFYYGNGNFCDQRCLYDWVNKYIDQGLDQFGRTTEAKHLTEENAWVKDYDWRIDDEQNRYFFYNTITKERRSLTEDQFNDSSYTLNTGE